MAVLRAGGSGGSWFVGAGSLFATRGLSCALAVGLVVAGGRRGRRKPGQDEPGENSAAIDGQNAKPGQAGREIPVETGDIEADQWLNPFRIGRPVTPIISPRQNWAEPAGGQPSHGPSAYGGPVQGRPVRVEPVKGRPVQAEPVGPEPARQVWHQAEPHGQIWHEPPHEQAWQPPAAQPDRKSVV